MTIERANSRKKVTWLSLAGLITIPAIIAGALLWANWNPQDRLDTVDAAIVNLDEAVTVDDQTVLLGRQLAAGLMSADADSDSTNFTWHLETADGAQSGIEDGSYVAALTIPENFSAAATSFSGDASDAQQATVEVTTSQSTALADPAIAQSISNAAVSVLNETLTSSYLENIYLGFNTLATQLGQLSDGASSLASAAGEVDAGATTLADGADELASGTTELANGAAELASGATELSDAGDTLESGASSVASGLDAYAAAISGTSEQAGLASAAQGLSSALDGAVDSLNASAAQAADSSTCPADVTSAAQAAIQSTATEVGVSATDTQLAYLAQTAATVACQSLSTGLSQAAQALSQQDPASGYSVTGLASTLSTGLSTLAESGSTLTDGAAELASGVSQYVSAVDTLADGATELSTGAASVAAGADSLSTGATSLSEGLDSLSQGAQDYADGVAEGASAVPTYTDSERENLASVAAEPVTTGEDGSIFSSSAAAGALIILAMWLGALATFVVIRPVTARAIESSRSALAMFATGIWPGLVVAAGATVLLTGIAASVLDLSTGTLVALAGFTLATAVTFTVIVYALVAAFGGAGRWLTVVLAVLGIATTLISGSPGMFQAAAAFSPLTPAANGFTAIASGGGGLGAAVAALLGWLAAGCALSAVAIQLRRRARPTTLSYI